MPANINTTSRVLKCPRNCWDPTKSNSSSFVHILSSPLLLTQTMTTRVVLPITISTTETTANFDERMVLEQENHCTSICHKSMELVQKNYFHKQQQQQQQQQQPSMFRVYAQHQQQQERMENTDQQNDDDEENKNDVDNNSDNDSDSEDVFSLKRANPITDDEEEAEYLSEYSPRCTKRRRWSFRQSLTMALL